MSKAKKFGAFAGVFTPSILTILGVIMYLRLGWVVGQGGLIITIGIILIAHIISVSTGLSISSIATDKKIKTGGIYYILSRSLGLPMGGAIGIALFVGTALSISLYIVGFTESFMGIEAISSFLNLTGSTNEIRVIATIVIIILVTLAFISTSLVIKTQYYILGAIALSLVSIGIGFFSIELPETHSIILKPSTEEIPFELIFAVFFPAVTGFTAGVAMSGDLKDPKKGIPLGTLSSILVGLIVYIVLAIGIAFFVDRDILINNSNFLIDIAWFSPLVVMGIWGATLSSALGGILGGPRIIQAISNDNITPKIFGKGYGDSNEPRNALILIFVIAELGILIGDLNMIAGVVSMFYLASYGFINLAYALESWASTDFRPSFRISKWIGIIGFTASFAVMFKLDTIAMFAALIIMAAIFLIIKRKELRVDYGDVWQSVWSSIVRTALHRIDKNKIEDRNWQPNIILFSGGTEKRPYLIEFGKNLVGNFGVLSNFDLIEKKSAKYLFPKHKQSVDNEKEDIGIFYRKQSVRDIYEGIEVISSTYGFSGIEPNTILMGWARQSKNPKKFANLIKRIYELDLNLILIDYDKTNGFGKKQTIDIWWRDQGYNNNLSLFLAKFLVLTDDWANSKLRLIIVSNQSLENEKILKKAQYTIDNLRIESEIKIINNQIAQKDFYDLIRIESIKTDLIYIGIPDIETNKEIEFVEKTSKLLQDIGTVVLVKAASFFKTTVFVPKEQIISLNIFNEKIDDVVVSKSAEVDSYNIKQDYKDILSEINQKINVLSIDINDRFLSNSIKDYLVDTEEYIQGQINRIKEINNSKDNLQFKEIFSSANTVIDKLNKISENNNKHYYEAINYFQKNINNIINELPDNLYVQYDINEIKKQKNDSISTKWKKIKLRFYSKFKSGEIKTKIKFKKFLRNKLTLISNQAIKNFISNWDNQIFEIFINYKELHQSLQLCIQLDKNSKKNECVWANNDINKIEDILNKFSNNETKILNQLSGYYHILNKEIADNLASYFANFNLNNIIKLTKQEKISQKNTINDLSEFTDKSFKLHKFYYNELKLEVDLIQLNIELYRLSSKIIIDLNKNINKILSKNIKIVESNINKAIEQYTDNENDKNKKFEDIIETDFDNIHTLINDVIKKYIDQIDISLNIVDEKTEVFENNISEEGDTKKILSYRLAEELIANNYTTILSEILETLPNKIKEIENDILNDNRLIKYSVFYKTNDSENKLKAKELDIKSFLDKKLAEIETINNDVNIIKEEINEKIRKNYNITFEKLQMYNFKKEANSWNQLLPKSEAISRISKIKHYYSKFTSFINVQVNQFWYKQSEAVILANQLTNNELTDKLSLNKILNLTEKVTIKKNVEKELPFYYKHLFLDENYYNKDFWFGRKEETQRAEKAYERFKNKYQAALLITGDKNSGKSFFINNFCQNHKKVNTYFVNTVNGGSTDKKQFLKALQAATKVDGDYKTIFQSLKKNSIVVIEDLELWWEKAENGNKVITEIYQLIADYSKKVFFIISANTYSYRIINQLVPANYIFLDIIKCSALNAKVLQKIIMFRHESSGLEFLLKSKKNKFIAQKDFTSLNYAKLFSKYFNYSNGNVGTALLNWVSNINQINESELIMQNPKNINASILDLLDNYNLLILNQFVIHNKLKLSRLTRILQTEKHILSDKIEFLKRTGIIVINNHKVMEINPYLNTQIVNLLKDKEVL